jgi:hypothetical protein
MTSITYDILYDKKWYYILDVDSDGLTKQQVKDVNAITNAIVKTLRILNANEMSDGKTVTVKEYKWGVK